MKVSTVKKRLDYLRREIIAERISTAEILELESLSDWIRPEDTLLREWAGLPEFPEEPQPTITPAAAAVQPLNPELPDEAQAEHTPGEWTVEDEGSQLVIISRAAGEEEQPAICRIYGRSERAKANARLIAAAPELLAALKDAESKLSEYRQIGYMSGWDKTRTDALAAIARATGKEVA